MLDNTFAGFPDLLLARTGCSVIEIHQTNQAVSLRRGRRTDEQPAMLLRVFAVDITFGILNPSAFLNQNHMEYEMKQTISLLLLALGIVGCGTVPRSSGVLPLGPDTYRVSARASMGSESESQKMAIMEGQQHCKSIGREFMVVGTKVLKDYGGYEATFRCLAANDPELRRPNLEKAPDTVIQVR